MSTKPRDPEECKKLNHEGCKRVIDTRPRDVVIVSCACCGYYLYSELKKKK
jgi:hypothetical protein